MDLRQLDGCFRWWARKWARCCGGAVTLMLAILDTVWQNGNCGKLKEMKFTHNGNNVHHYSHVHSTRVQCLPTYTNIHTYVLIHFSIYTSTFERQTRNKGTQMHANAHKTHTHTYINTYISTHSYSGRTVSGHRLGTEGYILPYSTLYAQPN